MEDYFKHAEGSVTVCDRDGNIIYMNSKSIATFGDMTGKNMFACHNPHSQEKIRMLLATGQTNAYTIEKQGRKKIIYQTPWRNEQGEIMGLIEYSFVIPFDMPHYVRK